MEKKKIGQQGEEEAALFLKRNGYEILDRNVFFRFAELDIVAKKDKTLVFVEVKTRQSLQYGLPREAVTKTKCRHIRNAAEAYLAKTGAWNTCCRFDVIEVWKTKAKWHIHHIKNAFDE